MITDLHHIPPVRRELFLRIWSGHANVHAIVTRLFYLDVHFPVARLDAALRWLIRNSLTGDRFLQFVDGDCAGSNLELHRKLIAATEKEKKTRPIFAGKDFRV